MGTTQPTRPIGSPVGPYFSETGILVQPFGTRAGMQDRRVPERRSTARLRPAPASANAAAAHRTGRGKIPPDLDIPSHFVGRPVILDNSSRSVRHLPRPVY